MNVWYRPTKFSAACFFRDPTPSQSTLSECGSWRCKVPAVNGKEERGAIEAGKYAPDFEICSKCAQALGTHSKPQRVREVKPCFFSAADLIPIEDMKLPRREEDDDEPTESVWGSEAQVDF